MKLLRVKLLSPFRGLPVNYELKFSCKDSDSVRNIDPKCFVGLNGSGKSNLLEAIVEIFYYLEKYRNSESDLERYKIDFGFEIEYILPVQAFKANRDLWEDLIHYWTSIRPNPIIKIMKQPNQIPYVYAEFPDKKFTLSNDSKNCISSILPSRIVAYSSGMNELISNPFIKMDFQYFDELEKERKSTLSSIIEMKRMLFLSYDSNKLISICCFLFDEFDFDMSSFESSNARKASEFGGLKLKNLKKELNINDISSFEVRLKLSMKSDEYLHTELNRTIEQLKKCATIIEENKKSNEKVIHLFYWVNNATKKAFRHYFKNPKELFRQLYFLQLMNHRLTSSKLREKITHLRTGSNENLSELIPKVESRELIFSINDIVFKKHKKEKVNYRNLSDGEHQLLQIFGSILLMDDDGVLFIFDEPETHFNPDWRSKFIQLVNQSIDKKREQEVIISTHSPFIVSDCHRENVYLFEREKNGRILPTKNPDINTFGASIDTIMFEIFEKDITMADFAYSSLKEIIDRCNSTNEKNELIKLKLELRKFGESIEKFDLLSKINRKLKEFE
jgi:restriction system-associated AAA family ATPase